MATLPLKASRNEHRSVIRFLWTKGLCPNAIHSEIRPVYGDKCFTRPAMHVWCKKLAEKCASDTEVQSAVCQWLGQQPASFFCRRHSETYL